MLFCSLMITVGIIEVNTNTVEAANYVDDGECILEMNIPGSATVGGTLTLSFDAYNKSTTQSITKKVIILLP